MLSRIRIGFCALSFLFLIPGFSLAQSRPSPLPPLDSLDLGEMQTITRSLQETAASLHTITTEKAVLYDSLLGLANQRLELAKADSTLAKPALDSLSKETKTAKDAAKKAGNLNARAAKAEQFIAAIPTEDSLSLRKSLPKAWKQVSQLYEELFPSPKPIKADTALVTTDSLQLEKPKKGKRKVEDTTAPTQVVPASKKFAVYNPSADVMRTPPPRPCLEASSSRDEFSGEITRVMAASELFRYTNPALKTYLQGKTHVICEAALLSAGANMSLQLTFRINDPNARKAFGRLEKNSLATLKFMDGSSFELQNEQADDGIFTPETGGSIFHGQYPLSAEAYKKLRRTPLDTIRILWSKGYEDYDVQQVDLLMQQAACLAKK